MQIGTGLDRFKLHTGPDGVYRIDGRVIPIRDDGPKVVGGIDNGQAVVGVHDHSHAVIGLVGRQRGVDVEKRENGDAGLSEAS